MVCAAHRFFQLEQRDAETGLDPTLFRMYEARLMRWLSPDPLAGDILNPQSLNRYAYVLNNPTNLIDPLGLFEPVPPPPPPLPPSFPFPPFPVPPPCDPWWDFFCDPVPTPPFWPPPPPPGGPHGGGGGGSGGGTPKPPQPPEKRPCIPRNEVNPAGQLILNALSFWAQETGVTYFVGVNLAGTFAKGVGATVEGSYLYAADPQGRVAIAQGLTLGGAVGGRAYGAGGQVGSATYQSVYDFAGPSYGGSAQASVPGLRIPVALGGGFSTNQAGVLTFATFGIGRGARATAGEVLSVGVQVTEVCPQ